MRPGSTVPRVGVNFALAQLRDPRLIEKIKWETERFDVEPGRIAIEVLETVLIKSDADIVVRNLRGLASAGFHVELDDFGTGHASIANLRRFMVDRIKIDRSFIAGIEASEEQRTLTASMIAMARRARHRHAGRGRRDRGGAGDAARGSAATSSRATSPRGRWRSPRPCRWLAAVPRRRAARAAPGQARRRPEYALTFRPRGC